MRHAIADVNFNFPNGHEPFESLVGDGTAGRITGQTHNQMLDVGGDQQVRHSTVLRAFLSVILMRRKFAAMATITLVVSGMLMCVASPVQADPQGAREKFAVGDNVHFELDGFTHQGRVLGYSDEFQMYRVEYSEPIINPEPTATIAPPKTAVRYIAGAHLARPGQPVPKVEDLTPLLKPTVPKPEELQMPAELAAGDQVEVTFLGTRSVGQVVYANLLFDVVEVELTLLGEKQVQKFKRHEVTKIIFRPGGADASLVRTVINETDPQVAIGRIDFSDDDRHVAVQMSDGIIQLHNVADGAKTESLKRWEFKEEVGDDTIINGPYVGHGYACKSEELVVVSEKTVQTLLIGEVDQTLIAANTFHDLARVFQAYAISPDGYKIAVASRRMVGIGEWKDLQIEIFDLNANGPPVEADRVQLKELAMINGQVNALAYSPDGKSLAINGIVHGATGEQSVVEIWPVGEGGFRMMDVDGGLLAFSPDGKFLATGRVIRELQSLEDVKAGNYAAKVVTLNTPLMPSAVVYDPKGKWIATGGADQRLAFWDPATGEKLACVRAADRSLVSLAVSHDGATIATTAAYTDREDCEATLWDVAAILKAAPKE